MRKLVKQYVSTGLVLPEHQLSQLSSNELRSYFFARKNNPDKLLSYEFILLNKVDKSSSNKFINGLLDKSIFEDSESFGYKTFSAFIYSMFYTYPKFNDKRKVSYEDKQIILNILLDDKEFVSKVTPKQILNLFPVSTEPTKFISKLGEKGVEFITNLKSSDKQFILKYASPIHEFLELFKKYGH